MSLPVLEADQFKKLILDQTPVIDVRAPIEFVAGSIPGSVNLPILTDLERQEIGTIYKQKGQEAAVARGYELVSGSVKEARVSAWRSVLEQKPQAVLTCFRGGQRSQITQQWLQQVGCHRPRIHGGYKAFRNFLIQELDRLSKREMCVVSGATGSGKSLLIREVIKFRPTVDLESLANHRGSAFGGYVAGQPTQVDFENELSSDLIRLEMSEDKRSLVVEDESRLIGRCAQPETFFQSLRVSPVVYVEESLRSRVDVTFEDYILKSPIGSGFSNEGLQTFARYRRSLLAISKKLGGLRYAEVEKDLLASEAAYLQGDLFPNKIWIAKLLEYYYDPLYFHSLEKRDPKILFRGSRSEVIEWLKNERLN